MCANRSGRLYKFNEPRRGIFPRVSSVKSVHVREEEEVIRVDHRRGDRRKRIVISKFYFLEELSGVRLDSKRTRYLR